MSCAAPAARPRAGLRAFILSLPQPRRLARRVGEHHAHTGKAFLFVLILALLGLQVELHAHALSYLPVSIQAAADAGASGALPDEDEERHVDVVCLECLAFAALDLPPAAPKAFAFDEQGATPLPVALATPASLCSRLQPRCRAPPPSALRPLPH